MEPGKIHFGYWGVRGLGQACRYALEAAGVEYTEMRYTLAEKDVWFDDHKKSLLVSPFPNIPYLIDGEVHVTEHDEILRYVAKFYKPELEGKDKAAYAQTSIIFTKLVKLNPDIRLFMFKDGSEEGAEVLWSKHHAELSIYNKLAGDHDFLAGGACTIADMYFYELWQCLKVIFGKEKVDKEFANLAKWEQLFEGQEWFKKYRASDKWIEYYLMGP